MRERQHGLVAAERVAAEPAVQRRKRPGEAERDLVVDAVHERKRLVVVDAGFRQHQDRGGADLEARVGRAREAVEPVAARGRALDRAERRAHGDAALVGSPDGIEAHDHLLEPADERRLAPACRDADALSRGAEAELDHRLALRARSALRLFENLRELGAGLGEEVPRFLEGAEVHIPRDDRLGEGHALVFLRPARVGERGVDLVAPRGAGGRVGARKTGRGRDEDAVPVLGPGRVDRGGVAVEDLAHLLARKRLEAARMERLVDPGVRREAEIAADAADFRLGDAVGGERLHEGVLDGEHLLVGEGLVVGAGAVDVVVDLAERGFAFELHLAGVVFAGRDVLELLEGDVDVGEVDGWHGGSPGKGKTV